MNDHLSDYKRRVIDVGLFLIFLAFFGKFVVTEIWHILGPLFGE